MNWGAEFLRKKNQSPRRAGLRKCFRTGGGKASLCSQAGGKMAAVRKFPSDYRTFFVK